MTKEAIIQKLAITLAILPKEEVLEIVNFALFLKKKHDDAILQEGIEILVEQSQTFQF